MEWAKIYAWVPGSGSPALVQETFLTTDPKLRMYSGACLSGPWIRQPPSLLRIRSEVLTAISLPRVQQVYTATCISIGHI